MTHVEMLSVIKAHAKGKIIQFRDNTINTWTDCPDNSPSWNFALAEYRVKPECQSIARPYKDKEECWKDMQNHHPFGWLKNKNGNYEHFSSICDDKDILNLMFYTYTYADGDPYGIK